MKKRNLLLAAGALSALYLARLSLKLSGELRRYNHILSMSNEGTVSQEMPELLTQVLKQERQTIKEWFNFMRSAPKDLMRYLKIESM